MKRFLLCLALTVVFAPARAQTTADSTAIVQTALDYIEGWYTGDADRMARAVHPELEKRIVLVTDGHPRLDQMGASGLIAGTRSGYGTRTPEAERRQEITILDIYENAASVRILARDWVDYLHLAKWNGDWMIVNVLWELTPEARAQRSGS